MPIGARLAAFAAGILLALGVSSAALANETTTYTYDALGRVLGVANTGSVASTVAITYDAAGNRTNYQVTGANSLISIADASTTEGGDLVFTVSRTGNVGAPAQVNFAVTDVTTVQSRDYTAPTATQVSFSANDTSETITIHTLDDSAYEGDRTLTVTLSSPSSGATLGTASATGTITTTMRRLLRSRSAMPRPPRAAIWCSRSPAAATRVRRSA